MNNPRKPVIEMSLASFAKWYFEILPEAQTTENAFDEVNHRHKQLLGYFKFKTYHDFKRTTTGQ